MMRYKKNLYYLKMHEMSEWERERDKKNRTKDEKGTRSNNSYSVGGLKSHVILAMLQFFSMPLIPAI